MPRFQLRFECLMCLESLEFLEMRNLSDPEDSNTVIGACCWQCAFLLAAFRMGIRDVTLIANKPRAVAAIRELAAKTEIFLNGDSERLPQPERRPLAAQDQHQAWHVSGHDLPPMNWFSHQQDLIELHDILQD